MTERIYNLKRCEEDLRDKIYVNKKFAKAIHLPPMADLRDKMPPVYD